MQNQQASMDASYSPIGLYGMTDSRLAPLTINLVYRVGFVYYCNTDHGLGRQHSAAFARYVHLKILGLHRGVSSRDPRRINLDGDMRVHLYSR